MIPTGMIVAFPGKEEPPGWAICDGTAFDINAYPELANLLPTGNVPDLRGMFLRGLDTTGSVDPDPGRSLLSTQADAVGPHTHTYTSPSWEDGNGFHGGSNAPNSANTGSNGGPETRPKNVAVNYIIYLGPKG